MNGYTHTHIYIYFTIYVFFKSRMITPTQSCGACMNTDIIYFVHWHVEASPSREDDQDYTVLDHFAGFDNETLAKVFEHVTGTGRRQCNQLSDIS